MQDDHPTERRVTAERNSVVSQALRKIEKDLSPSKIFCVAAHVSGVVAAYGRFMEHEMTLWEGAQCVLG